MKSASPALKALLASKRFIYADFYTFEIVTGDKFYYTTYDIDLVYGGYTFKSNDMLISRDSLTWEVGVVVSTMKLTLTADDTCLINGVPILRVLHNGGFDGGRVNLERVFMATPGDTSAGTVLLFDGPIGDIDPITRTTATITVNTDMQLLNIQMPRNLYQ
jgi:hypothetical protein